ncbi:hypothetical protein HG264_01160 [Pseudomonas sp. gcc21]|uniref:HNH endonuclease n=1 Tax=Pseudomonas sp. gcc21 TaxID=2726989 RepID=UPI00145175DC|nr:HNH endonuclease [Pseudomonas sp. gcc21]QJD57613.1 hypothetical protein HG264_01160 [Pseudomonas sp. gcc21]
MDMSKVAWRALLAEKMETAPPIIRGRASAKRYAMALRQIENEMSHAQRAMLIGHASAPEQTLCMREIAQLGGYETYNTGNLKYGELAHELADALGITSLDYWVHCLATFYGAPGKPETQATMHPELYEALVQIGWIPDSAQKVSAIELSETEQALPVTERTALIKARVGQSSFRLQLIEYWNGCAVTGCGDTRLLLASHIKPWCVASGAERLDPFNGLLLTPNLDLAFDQGLISFDDIGQILLRDDLDPDSAQTLNITPKLRLRQIDSRHHGYLAWHREHLFRK